MVMYYAAAAATATAGLLHLMLGPNNLGFNVNQGMLFIVGGTAQVFWIIPTVRRWGTPWHATGMGGTAVFMALFLITRMPGNPITGRGGGANPMSIAVEVFEATFIGLAAAIIVYENRMKKRLDEKSPTELSTRKNKKLVPIHTGIVVALVLAGLFVLPMTMPRPMGGPPVQGGSPGIGQFGQQPQGQQAANLLGGSTNQTCTLTPSLVEVESTPQQTEGPYFVDGMPNRSDITSDTSTGSLQQGIPLNLAVNVYDVDNGSCIPLSGAHVDMWHADSQGVYSEVLQQGTSGQNFLRGYQITNENGTAKFSTVYPGWYEGRAIHIHVKVRTFEGTQETSERTSQFYLPDSVNEQVHTQPPYSNHGPVDIPNEEDGIYAGASTDGLIQSNTGQHLMLNLAHQDQGYLGTFNVILDAHQTG